MSSLKDTVRKMENQATNWEKIFYNTYNGEIIQIQNRENL